MVSDTPVAYRPVVLVGAGRWGRVHVQQWSKICVQAPLIIVDLDIESSRELARTYQVQSCSSLSESMEELRHLPRPLICIITPIESLDDVALEASQWSDLMFVEKPGVSTMINAQGAVGYIERFNPIRAQLKSMIFQSICADPSLQLDTCRLSQYAPRSATRLLNDLFCHDFDLLLGILEDFGYQLVELADISTILTTHKIVHHLNVNFRAKFHLLTPQSEKEKSLSMMRLPSLLTVDLKSVIGRGDRQRSWHINQKSTYHLTDHPDDINPLYDQCKLVYDWSLDPIKPLPNPLCSIQQSAQRIRLLRQINHYI